VAKALTPNPSYRRGGLTLAVKRIVQEINMNTNLQYLQEYITLAKDVVTILAALVAATVAIMGLRTWKKQLRGKTEYELARRLLCSVYRVRDAIRIVRNPFVSSAEAVQSMQETEMEIESFDPRNTQHTVLRQQAVYQRRWKGIQEAFMELDVDALEAEVIWEHDIAEHLQLLRQHTSTLYANIQRYLRNLSNPPRHQETESLREIDRIIYAAGEDNAFSAGVLAAIEGVENHLKAYLKL